MINKVLALSFNNCLSFGAKRSKKADAVNLEINFGKENDTFESKFNRNVYNEPAKVKNKSIESFRFNEDFVIENSVAKKLTAQKEGSIIDCKIDEIHGNSELTVIDTRAKKILVQGKVLALSSDNSDKMSFDLMSSRKSSVILKGGVGNSIKAWKTAYLQNAVVNELKGLDGVILTDSSHADKIISSEKVVLTGGSTAGLIKMVLCPDKCSSNASVYLDKGSLNTKVTFSIQRPGTVFVPRSLEKEPVPEVKNGEIVYVEDEAFQSFVAENKKMLERPSF